VASTARFSLNLQRVRVVALVAVAVGLDVGKATDVLLVGVLVGALHLVAEQGRAGGKVVDVDKA
jgi:hypothetical protein